MSGTVLSPRRRQWLAIGGIFAVVFALLAAGYYLILSGGYTVLADGVRPGEAAAIVAELDKRGTAYRLRDGGTTILVPDGEADATRLALVRSDAVAAGQIGFELFNKSDMGLTNFAQKINYQRALQGELVRTITAMDGVETARVHLAMPERSLFRDDRTEPSAAVTLTMHAGLPVEPSRVAGIQRLVAAAVPDLPVERVVVLDAGGRVISPTGPAGSGVGDPADAPAELEARTAVERYYHARVRSEVETARPGLRYSVRVAALPQPDTVSNPSDWTPGGTGDARNFRLRVTLVTAEPLDADAQAALRTAIVPAIGLDDARGDVLLFQAGLLDAAVPPAVVRDPVVVGGRYPPPAAARPVEPAAWTPAWMIGVLVALALLAGWIRRRAARTPPLLSAVEHDAFAQQLRRQLALTGGAGHAAE